MRLWAEVATSEDKEERRGAPGAGGQAAGLCGETLPPSPLAVVWSGVSQKWEVPEGKF